MRHSVMPSACHQDISCVSNVFHWNFLQGCITGLGGIEYCVLWQTWHCNCRRRCLERRCFLSRNCDNSGKDGPVAVKLTWFHRQKFLDDLLPYANKHNIGGYLCLSSETGGIPSHGMVCQGLTSHSTQYRSFRRRGALSSDVHLPFSNGGPAT